MRDMLSEIQLIDAIDIFGIRSVPMVFDRIFILNSDL